MKGQTVFGALKANDTDPEGDNTIVMAQGSFAVPIVTADGSYFVETNGNFQFTPNDDFAGNTEITYTICDDNAEVACTDATVHILVFDDITLNIRVYLEGPCTIQQGRTAFTV